MTIDEIKVFLEQTKDDAGTKAFLESLVKPATVTPELINEYLATEEGLKFVKTHPAVDQRVTEAIATHKEKQKTINDAEVKRLLAAELVKLHPEETPEQQRLKALEEKLLQTEKERELDNRKRRFMEKATEMKIDITPIIDDYVPASDEQGILYLQKLAKRDADLAAKIKNEIVAAGSYRPGSAQGDKTKPDLDKLTFEQALKMEADGTLNQALAG